MTDECQCLYYCRSLKDVANVFKPFSAAGSLCDPTPEIFLGAESLWQQNYRKTIRGSTKGIKQSYNHVIILNVNFDNCHSVHTL